MARDWDDRDRYQPRRNRSDYDYDRGYRSEGNRGDRDWSDRAGDEVRSWFGDDDAERRRRMDERHDRSSGGNYGGYGSGSGYDYGNGRNPYRDDRYSGSGYGSGHRGDHGGRDRDWSERAGDEVRSWFGDDDAERRRRRDEMEDERRSRSHSDDYRHWRTEQVRKLDKDYEDYASERRQQFAKDFDDWRSKRPSGQAPSGQGTTISDYATNSQAGVVGLSGTSTGRGTAGSSKS